MSVVVPLTDEQKQTILQLLTFANISRDLDRNREDTAFVDGGGKIIYVLDENIFEMFIHPHDHTRDIETFYSDVWNIGKQGSRARRRYEAQSALLTTEHLVCRELPGGQTGILYTTEPHKWELADRLFELSNEIRRRMIEQPERMEDALRSKVAVLRDLLEQAPRDETRAGIPGTEALDAELKADLRSLSRAGTPQLVNDRVNVTRTAAEVLAMDTLAEPLDQLQRLVSGDMRSRIRDIQERFQCLPNDRRAIEIDAGKWLGRLREELALPHNKTRKRAQRQDDAQGALHNDAFSIAYLRWIAMSSLDTTERLVFITGDSLLFDTYRRWYSGDECDPTAEPFFMRRVAQYSPVFNPTDSGGDLSRHDHLASGRHTIFDQVQQAIESTLLPLEVSSQTPSPNSADAKRRAPDPDGLFSKRRERLALRLNEMEDVSPDGDLAELARKISTDWLRSQRDSLEEFQRLWQSTQRLAIGASYALVCSRLTEAQRKLVASFHNSTAEDQAAAALSDYARSVLTSLFEESVQLWIPLAREFLEGKSKQPGWVPPTFQRLTLALELDKQFAGQDFDRVPELLFARAACHAVSIQDPNNAYRFAMLALRADEAAQAQGNAVPQLEAELQYLATVTCRLLICTIDVSDRRADKTTTSSAIKRGITQIKDLYAEGSSLVDGLVTLHFGESQGGDEKAKLRLIRALSERASLNLFVATAFGLTGLGEADLGIGRTDYTHYLALARGDLRLCAIQDKKWKSDHVLLQPIRDQYVPNVAGYETLAFLLTGNDDYMPQQWPKRVFARLSEFQLRERRPHPLLRAELVAFSLLLDGAGSLKIIPDGREYGRGLQRLRLTLDKLLYKQIFKKILGASSIRRLRRG